MLRRTLVRQRLGGFNEVRRGCIAGQNRLMAVRFYTEKKEDSEKPEGASIEEKTESSNEPAPAPGQPADSWKLKFEEKDRELAKTKDLYLRSVADFRNLQETTKREIQKAKDYALQKFAKDLLESADNMDRALTAVPESSISDDNANKDLIQLHEGISMVKNVFEKTLAKHGLVKLDPLGEKFDPNIHEATFEVPQPDKEPGTIFHVQQTGFALHGRVIRAPKVGVVKA